jgi:hypothetical protein
MVRRIVVALAACAGAGAVMAAPGLSSSGERELAGTVGPSFTISLTKDGAPVSAVRPGTYWLTVHDLSDHHNFHLFGPGLDDVVTTVAQTGTVTVKIHLSHGEYTFQCDPHFRGMHGSFVVGGVGQVD